MMNEQSTADEDPRFNLRDKADIVTLAQTAGKELDSRELIKYFDTKLLAPLVALVYSNIEESLVCIQEIIGNDLDTANDKYRLLVENDENVNTTCNYISSQLAILNDMKVPMSLRDSKREKTFLEWSLITEE